MSGEIRMRLLADPAGRDASKCFTCGMCVAGCPVGYHAPEYNLVQNLWDAFYRDDLSPRLWWCATCYTCQDRCPHDVRMVEIIFLLQRLSVERCGRPDCLHLSVSQVERTGYLGDIAPGLNRRREQMGLPPLLGLALGLEPEALGLDRNRPKMDPAGLGVKANGGQPA